MAEKVPQPNTVDEYLAQFPEAVQQEAQRLRALIKELVPEAEEKISYGMAGYYLNGWVVWFGAWKKHLSIYPFNTDDPAFRDELSGYSGTKGAVHFPFNRPVPYDLIRRMIQVRLEEIQNQPPRPSET